MNYLRHTLSAILLCLVTLLVSNSYLQPDSFVALAQEMPVNVALRGNGGVASASSFINGYPFDAVNNGDRKGVNWGNGGGWNDSTVGQYPDWVRVDFSGSKTINEVDVFTLQDNYGNPVEPSEGQAFALYGIVDFDVQYWDGSTWALLPNGSLRNNNKVWVQIIFPAVTTSAIRVVVYRGATGAFNPNGDYSRIVELEAWGSSPSMPAPGPTPDDVGLDQSETEIELATMLRNVASSANGGRAVASSTYSDSTARQFSASSAIDGERTGVNWENNGGWADNTQGSYPDWLRVNFNDQKILSEVDVFTLRDNFRSGVQPTLDETFNQYGITDFRVQYLVPNSNPEQWADVPDANVVGNQNVWRKFTFANITTGAIRIYVTATRFPPPSSYSRIVEVEAWGVDALMSISLPSGGASTCNQYDSGAPCALDLDLKRAINGQPTLSNWMAQLDWNYSSWNGVSNPDTPAHLRFGSQNLPVLAHAIALWKGLPGAAGWWSTFLTCQTGDPCTYANPYPNQHIKYFKGTEPFSNVYDYHVTAAVVAVRYWAVRKLLNNPANDSARDLGNKARRYLRLNWALYTLGAGKQSAQKLLHRFNLKNPGDQLCQQKDGADTYNGYFIAMAGMRSRYFPQDVCEDDRATLLMEALEIPYFAKWESTTLDLVRDIESQPQGNFFDPGENVYALTKAHRDILMQHVQDGSQAKFLTDFLSTVRLSTPYHILGWYNPNTKFHTIVSMMEKNYNHNTSAVYAYKYTEVNRTVQIIYPWSNKDSEVRCGTPHNRAPYRLQISNGYARFAPVGSSIPSLIESSNRDFNDPNDTPSCVHEDGKPIFDSMQIPAGGWQYHIFFDIGKSATCTTASGLPCQ